MDKAKTETNQLWPWVENVQVKIHFKMKFEVWIVGAILTWGGRSFHGLGATAAFRTHFEDDDLKPLKVHEVWNIWALNHSMFATMLKMKRIKEFLAFAWHNRRFLKNDL